MDRKNLGLLVDGLDRGAHRLHRETGRDGAHQRRGAPGALKVQRQIQAEPGLQGFDHGAQPALLRADALDARVVAFDGFRGAQRPGKAGVVEQDAVFQLGLCGEKLRLFRRILIQQGDGVRQTRVPGFEAGELTAFPVDKRSLLAALQRAFGLGELHAAAQGQLLEQFLLAVADSQQPELFHLYNGHLSCSLSFPLLSPRPHPAFRPPSHAARLSDFPARRRAFRPRPLPSR